MDKNREDACSRMWGEVRIGKNSVFIAAEERRGFDQMRIQLGGLVWRDWETKYSL